MSQPCTSPEIAEASVRGQRARKSDVPFFLVMGGLSASFVVLIVLLLAADVMFTSFVDFRDALLKPEIRAAFRLTLLSCTIAAMMSLWVGTPLGYLLSHDTDFPVDGWSIRWWTFRSFCHHSCWG